MSKKYNNLSLKGKLVVQSDRKLRFIMNPLKTYYGLNNIGMIGSYTNYYKNKKSDENRILYESRNGKNISDSPYAIFKYLLENKDFNNYVHIWSLDSKKTINFYREKFSEFKNVKFVLRHSNEYLKEISRVKYLFNNSSFPIYFSTKNQQIYVNTWHGTPLKHLGLDLENGVLGIQNLTRNFLHSRYILTQNKHTTDIFKKSFQLENLFDGNFIEDGYPRTDLILNDNNANLINSIKKTQVRFNEDKKTILYAPTYRGDYLNPSDDIEKLYSDLVQLKNQLNYNILLKAHPFVYDVIQKDERFKEFLILDYYDINELLSLVDILITDYSSVFFDYLVTNNPIIFYTEDYEKYKNERGLYIDIDQLPKPTINNIDDLISTIQNEYFSQPEYKNNYKRFKEIYTPFDNGKVSERLVNRIFKNKIDYSKKTDKERILIYAGGMMNNGITISLLNLLEKIDYERYEVTIFLQRKINKISLDNIKRVNENVNIILRSGAFFADLVETYRNNFVKDRGILTNFERTIFPKYAYSREFRRLFGNTQFDIVIDFSGYSMFWSNLLLSTKSDKKLVYLHSDMKQDLHKVVNNKKPHAINLKGLMTIYPEFDYLVNVSENVKEINKEKLSNLNLDDKFVVSKNLLNIDEVKSKVEKQDNIIKINDDSYKFLANSPTGVELVPFNKNNFNIFASGRLSPEKGFNELIEAFDKVAYQNEEARLYILGEGKERSKYENLIERKGLESKVYLLGHQTNPFSLIKFADLFVLSSHYEGQGLVLLESLLLGLNVLSNDLEVTREILEDGKFGMLYDGTIEKLKEGIETFINNKQPKFEEFNGEEYNLEAINDFEKLLK